MHRRCWATGQFVTIICLPTTNPRRETPLARAETGHTSERVDWTSRELDCGQIRYFYPLTGLKGTNRYCTVFAADIGRDENQARLLGSHMFTSIFDWLIFKEIAMYSVPFNIRTRSRRCRGAKQNKSRFLIRPTGKTKRMNPINSHGVFSGCCAS